MDAHTICSIRKIAHIHNCNRISSKSQNLASSFSARASFHHFVASKRGGIPPPYRLLRSVLINANTNVPPDTDGRTVSKQFSKQLLPTILQFRCSLHFLGGGFFRSVPELFPIRGATMFYLAQSGSASSLLLKSSRKPFMRANHLELHCFHFGLFHCSTRYSRYFETYTARYTRNTRNTRNLPHIPVSTRVLKMAASRKQYI